jgi:branched-subunit amino acid transport protein
MEDTPVENNQDKNDQNNNKNTIWLVILCCLIILVILLFLPCLSNHIPLPTDVNLCLVFISLCWICALLICVITNLLFTDGVSRSNLYIIRILCQCAMLMVITGLLLIILVSIKMLFF